MKLYHRLYEKPVFLSPLKLLGLLFLVTLVIDLFSVDRILADKIYLWEGNSWYLKNQWFTATFVHKGGKYLSIAVVISVTLMLIASYLLPTLLYWRKRLQYLLTASLLGTATVSFIKSISHISCPWDFSRYGGTFEYLSLIEQLWLRNGSNCFPAGHASAGYAWVAFYFAGLYTNATWRWWGLGFALLSGFVFGISQQFRGAHFLSHDLWSLGICWIVCLICYEWMLKPHAPF